MAEHETKPIHNSDSESEEEFKGFENLSHTTEEIKTRPKNPIRLHLQKIGQQFRNLLRSPLSSSDDEFLECEGLLCDDEYRDTANRTSHFVEIVKVPRDDENNVDVSPRKQKKMDSNAKTSNNKQDGDVEKIISKTQELELTSTINSDIELNKAKKLKDESSKNVEEETNFS